MQSKYNEILTLPHHVSKTRKCMPRENRAAQFAPFAALTGYDDVIEETGRFTDSYILPDEDIIAELDAKLQFLKTVIDTQPEVKLMYFKPDEKKSGGAYLTVRGSILQIREQDKKLIFTDGKQIPIERMVSLEVFLPSKNGDSV